MKAIKQLIRFGYEQALSCIFPVIIFASLAITKFIDLPFLSRYDWLLIICLVAQVFMIASGLETKKELVVITLFHIIGLTLEIFKVNMDSWVYPEEAFTKIFGVPLYSGFMYASVASYLCRGLEKIRCSAGKMAIHLFSRTAGSCDLFEFLYPSLLAGHQMVAVCISAYRIFKSMGGL